MLFKKRLPRNFTCDCCGREVFGGERVCKVCKKDLPYNVTNVCPRCGRKSPYGGYCGECAANDPNFDVARSSFVYEGEARRLILRFKSGEKYLIEALMEFLTPRLEEFSDAEIVTFVPMTRKAEKRRGYNQSKMLALRAAVYQNLPLFEGIAKVKESRPQKTLGYRDRMLNLKGYFRVRDRKEIKGKRVLLLDDTMTTGATASEIARCLKAAGADKVYVLTVASVPCRKNELKQSSP